MPGAELLAGFTKPLNVYISQKALTPDGVETS